MGLSKYKGFLLGLAIGGVGVYFTFNKTIKTKQLNKLETKYEALHIDSLLDSGDFDEALHVYEENFRKVKATGYLKEVKHLLEKEKQLNDTILILKGKLRKERKRVAVSEQPVLVSDNILEKSTAENSESKDTTEHSNLPVFKPSPILEQQGSLDFTNPDGIHVKYLGGIVNGKAQGFGFAILDRKGFYEGDWISNQRHGSGIYIWQNGDRYEGEYDHGVRSGYGTYYFSSGEVYSGQWKNNLRQGDGKIVNKKGKVIFDGKWYDDEPVASAKKKKNKNND